MTASRRRCGAFTLLEAVLATIILSSVIVVSLDIRARSLRQVSHVREARTIDREMEMLFTEATAGLMGDPVVDRDAGVLRWEGTHLGDDFTLVARPDVVQTTESGADATDQGVRMWRYTLTWRGRDMTFFWHS